MRHKFRGKSYTIRFVHRKPTKGRFKGTCDCPTSPDREIVIWDKVNEKDYLITLLHECIHSCLWDTDEEAVDETSKSIANLLWKLGYRKNVWKSKRRKG